VSEEQLERQRERDLRQKLEQTYGRVMASSQIAALLVFPSTAAFRQARRRGSISIRMFTMPGRRGSFAMTQDVAAWLAQQPQDDVPGKTPC
jgi:hypothetical protein